MHLTKTLPDDFVAQMVIGTTRDVGLGDQGCQGVEMFQSEAL